MYTLLAIKRIGLFALLLVTLAGRTGSQAAEDNLCQQLSPAAQTHLTSRIDIIPSWRQASIAEPVAHYDLDDRLSACVFPVLKAGSDAGYIVISTRIAGNPVVEYSENPAAHRLAEAETRLYAAEEGLQIDVSRPLYLGALSYYYKVCDGRNCINATSTDTTNTYKLIEIGKQDIISVSESRSPTENNPSLKQVKKSSSSHLASSMSGYVSGVPNNYNRNWKDANGCSLGCAPSAVGAVLKYWDDHGYPNLVSPNGVMTMLWNLHNNYLYTDCAGWSWIPYPSVTFGGQAVAYAAYRGYNNFGYTHRLCLVNDSTCYNLYTAGINQQHPAVLTFAPWPLKQGVAGHVVAGVGYYNNELIVYDNAWGIGKDTYITYGQNYTVLLLDILQPPATP